MKTISKVKVVTIRSGLNLKKEFGSLKHILKKPTEQIMREIDEGLE